MIKLNEREAAGVYLQLKKNDGELDMTLCRLLVKIEKVLYARLSIQEIENLEELYRKGTPLSSNGGKKND